MYIVLCVYIYIEISRKINVLTAEIASDFAAFFLIQFYVSILNSTQKTKLLM